MSGERVWRQAAAQFQAIKGLSRKKAGAKQTGETGLVKVPSRPVGGTLRTCIAIGSPPDDNVNVAHGDEIKAKLQGMRVIILAGEFQNSGLLHTGPGPFVIWRGYIYSVHLDSRTTRKPSS